MAQFAVTVKETHYRTVIVVADGPEDAQIAAVNDENWIEEIHVEFGGMDKSDPLSFEVCDRSELFENNNNVTSEP